MRRVVHPSAFRPGSAHVGAAIHGQALPLLRSHEVRGADHVALAGEVLERMTALGIDQVPLVVGGIIPPEDAEALKAAGVAGVYTPKDFDLTQILGDIVEIVAAGREAAA